MPYSNEEFQKRMLEGQDNISKEIKSHAKLITRVAAEISTVKNNADSFEKEVKQYIYTNPHTHQKGLIEQVSENKDDIATIKTDIKSIWVKIKAMCVDLSKTVKDVAELMTTWKVRAGQISIVLAIGGVIWKIFTTFKK